MLFPRRRCLNAPVFWDRTVGLRDGDRIRAVAGIVPSGPSRLQVDAVQRIRAQGIQQAFLAAADQDRLTFEVGRARGAEVGIRAAQAVVGRWGP